MDSKSKYKRHIFPSMIQIPHRPYYDVMTQVYQSIIALLGLIILLPLLSLIAICVKLTSQGAILYKGNRVGKDQSIFNIYKFRTMYEGSEQKIGQRLVLPHENHYTPIGKFLRKYRLDELPQLWNVVCGDMALVGPRPVRPIFLDQYLQDIAGYHKRFLVKPGITGLAQVRGGYYTKARHKLLYELLYIKHRSVFFDIKLIILTFVRVLNKILNVIFILTWLLLASLALPHHLQSWFKIQVSHLDINILHFILPVVVSLKIWSQGLQKKRVYILQTPADKWVMLYLGLALIGTFLSLDSHIALRGTVWYICHAFIPFYLCLNHARIQEKPWYFIGILTTIIAVIAMSALGQTLYDWYSMSQWKRVGSNLDQPLWLALLMVLFIPVTHALYLHCKHTLKHTEVSRTLMCKMLMGLQVIFVLTFIGSASRLAWILLAFTLCLWTSNKIRVGLFVGCCLSFILVAQLGHQRFQWTHMKQDIETHLNQQNQMINHIHTYRFVIGIGAGTTPSYLKRAHQNQGIQKSHTRFRSSMTTIWVEQGFLGLLCLLMVIFSSMNLVYREIKRTHNLLLKSLFIGLLSALGMSIFCDLWASFPLTLLFWSLLGFTVGIAIQQSTGVKRTYQIIHAQAPL